MYLVIYQVEDVMLFRLLVRRAYEYVWLSPFDKINRTIH